MSRIADTVVNAPLVLWRSVDAHAASPKFILEPPHVLFQTHDEPFCRTEVDSLEGGLVVQRFDRAPVMGNGASNFQYAELPSGMRIACVHAVQD